MHYTRYVGPPLEWQQHVADRSQVLYKMYLEPPEHLHEVESTQMIDSETGDESDFLHQPLITESNMSCNDGVPRAGDSAADRSRFAAFCVDWWSRPVHSDTELSFLVLGLIGICTLILLTPVIPLLDAVGLEPFEWPSVEKLSLLIANASMDVVYNVLLLLGILLTSPLFMAVGCMLVVPASILADWLVHGSTLSPQALAGACIVVSGFAVLKAPFERCRRNTAR